MFRIHTHVLGAVCGFCLIATHGCGGSEDGLSDLEATDEKGSTFELDEAEGVEFQAGGKADGSYLSLADTIIPFEQDDPAWKSTLMFKGRQDCRKALGGYGCAIVAHNMLMTYYGGRANPREHSDQLGEEGAHVKCDLDWNGARQPEVTYRGSGEGTTQLLRSELDQGFPVIAMVRKAGKRRCHHFVLVTGYRAPASSLSDFEILDPASGTKRSLSTYAGVCSTRLFRGPDTPAPFIGTPCSTDDECSFEEGGEGFCYKNSETNPGSRGFCSVRCEGTCPDMTGRASTFCVSEGEGHSGGICASKADSALRDCRGVPGTMPVQAERHIGNSGTAPAEALVCMPEAWVW